MMYDLDHLLVVIIPITTSCSYLTAVFLVRFLFIIKLNCLILNEARAHDGENDQGDRPRG